MLKVLSKAFWIMFFLIHQNREDWDYTCQNRYVDDQCLSSASLSPPPLPSTAPISSEKPLKKPLKKPPKKP